MNIASSSRSVSRTVAIALVLLGAGCGSAAPVVHTTAVHRADSASDPCRGGDLVLAEVLAHCQVDAAYAGPPDPRDLRADADPVVVSSGGTARVTLTFENATSSPLEVWMERPSASFATSVWQGATRVDERDEASLRSGIVSGCDGDCRAVRVVLEPGGYLRGAVDVSARVSVLAVAPMDGALEQIVPQDAGPLAPGAYQLAVSLPWSDRSADSTVALRELRTTFTVAP